MSAGGHAQLALRFPLSPRARFADFLPGRNDELIRRLRDLDDHSGGFCGYLLVGQPGSGRSHLLQAVCHAHGERGAIYLPLADPLVVPELLDGLEALQVVALDDVQAWLGREAEERALLALYQGLAARGGRLVVSVDRPPGALSCHFADLCSRLRGLPTYEVLALDDAGRATLLAELAQQRGLDMAAPVLDFWLSRSSRNLTSLLDQLERLDDSAMAAQRRVTVPLVKQVLDL